LIEEQARHRGLIHCSEANDVAQRIFTGATAVVAVSGGVARYVENFSAVQGRVHVVHNGVDVGRFRPDVVPALAAAPDTFTIGFAGNARPWHGLPVLIEAFEKLHQGDSGTRLLVVGGGDLDEIEADVAKRGVGKAVHFSGAVDPEAMPSWLAAMDVAVAPYPKMEQFYFSPLKVFEYMASARAIVASEIGELPQIIRHEENGLLCQAGSAERLCEALQRLRADVALRRHLGETARRDALDHSWDAVASRILAAAGFTDGKLGAEQRQTSGSNKRG
jgi:glycosyltransferase involved in cell wall biosynthesis